jgi:hypothetical protein
LTYVIRSNGGLAIVPSFHTRLAHDILSVPGEIDVLRKSKPHIWFSLPLDSAVVIEQIFSGHNITPSC